MITTNENGKYCNNSYCFNIEQSYLTFESIIVDNLFIYTLIQINILHSRCEV